MSETAAAQVLGEAGRLAAQARALTGEGKEFVAPVQAA
jgi:hypothetical protein